MDMESGGGARRGRDDGSGGGGGSCEVDEESNRERESSAAARVVWTGAAGASGPHKRHQIMLVQAPGGRWCAGAGGH